MAQQNPRVQQQRRQSIILLLLMLVLLMGAAYYFLVAKPDNTQKQNMERPAGQVAIPVASRKIELGERVSGNMFTVTYKKPSEVPADILLNVDQFVGRFATKPILQSGYFYLDNISEPDVSGGYSAIAKPGKRVVVLNSSSLPGAITTLNIGDRIDLLAIGSPGDGSFGTAPQARTAADSSVSIEGGGAQPGDPNSQARKRARARAAGAGMGGIGAATATLVAENAEVLRIPKKGPDTEFVVLQMSAQDAHVTTLMAAAGATMRVVFRPYHDETAITKQKELKITTRIPKPEPDPDAVTIISGVVGQKTRPQSQAYAIADANRNNNEQSAEPVNDVYSDTASARGLHNEPIYKDIKVQISTPAPMTDAR